MRLMIGTNVFAGRIAAAAPAGYTRVAVDRSRYGCHPGYVLCGPGRDSVTTVCLISNDDGSWFREMVERAGGKVTEEEIR